MLYDQEVTGREVRRRLAAAEDQLRAADGEGQQLRANIARYDTVVTDYKEQIRRSQQDNEEVVPIHPNRPTPASLVLPCIKSLFFPQLIRF